MEWIVFAVLSLLGIIVFAYKQHKKKELLSKLDRGDYIEILTSTPNLPASEIRKSNVYSDLPPVESILATELWNRGFIPLKAVEKGYATLFESDTLYPEKQFMMLEEPFLLILPSEYGAIWQSLVKLPKNKTTTHFLIGRSEFKGDRFQVEIAELIKKR